MKIMQKLAIILLLLGFGSLGLLGQTGGQSTYALLNLAPNARVAGLGGFAITAPGDDPALAYLNPSLISSAMDNRLSLNYANYLADIQYGYLAYGQQIGSTGTWTAGLQYLNYGEFIEANEYGDITGSFSAAEYTLTLSGAWDIDSLFRIGGSLRPIYSVLERYQSWGLSGDMGIHFHSPNGLTNASVLIRNFGTQLSTYSAPEKEPLPFEVLGGISYKIKHAPFRIHLTARHLNNFWLRPEGGYGSIPTDDETTWTTFKRYAQAATDHLIAGVEFEPGKLLTFRLSYHFLRRFEMHPGIVQSGAGFAFGGGLHLDWIHLEYAWVNYHFSSRNHLLSVVADLNGLKKIK